MLTRVLKMATENAAKRLKTSSPDAIRIGTHSGHFHADEALAVFMLRQAIVAVQSVSTIGTVGRMSVHCYDIQVRDCSRDSEYEGGLDMAKEL